MVKQFDSCDVAMGLLLRGTRSCAGHVRVAQARSSAGRRRSSLRKCHDERRSRRCRRGAPISRPALRGGIRTSRVHTTTVTRPASRSSGRTICRTHGSTASRQRNSSRSRSSVSSGRFEQNPTLSEFPGATSPMHWFENYFAANSRAWLVSDPPDGRSPPSLRRAASAPRRVWLRGRVAGRPIRGRIAACTTVASRAGCPGR